MGIEGASDLKYKVAKAAAAKGQGVDAPGRIVDPPQEKCLNGVNTKPGDGTRVFLEMTDKAVKGETTIAPAAFSRG